MEVVIALLMFMWVAKRSNIKNIYLYKSKMARLKMQRQARKSTNGDRVVYQCAKVKATVIDEYSGQKK